MSKINFKNDLNYFKLIILVKHGKMTNDGSR